MNGESPPAKSLSSSLSVASEYSLYSKLYFTATSGGSSSSNSSTSVQPTPSLAMEEVGGSNTGSSSGNTPPLPLLPLTLFDLDTDGHHSVCAVCGDGGNILLCDAPDCPKAFHSACLEELNEDLPGDDDDSEWLCPPCCRRPLPRNAVLPYFLREARARAESSSCLTAAAAAPPSTTSTHHHQGEGQACHICGVLCPKLSLSTFLLTTQPRLLQHLC